MNTQPAQLSSLSSEPTPSLPHSPATHWLPWAVFLASSWTWCIGMFLPVILVREYGLLAWLVFAVPNVVGAAAMGWLLRTARSSIDITQRHHEACTIFSGVTIAFHLFFAMAVISPLADNLEVGLGSVLAAGVLMYILMTRQRGADRVLAGIAYLLSLGTMVWWIRIVVRQPVLIEDQPLRSGIDLLWLLPVCTFGFATCPYLDLTFHRARQHANCPRAAFGVGFGVLFLIMILYTLLYSRAINGQLPRFLGWLLFVHMAMQSAFTVAAHARELQRRGDRAIALAIVLTLTSWAAHVLLRRGALVDGMHAGELIYRVFMGFYGLVFPAYVWLVMLPTRRQPHWPSWRHLLVFAAAVILATPFFWIGFVQQRTIWLAPGLAIVLLARLLVPYKTEAAL
ncbi:hypothetical protein [Fontivita pretiosa]|uniref:hypothetical protein n=1 Tax=Fontivita pretiosa TaxID=2989684 RepID=UPI003D17C11D